MNWLANLRISHKTLACVIATSLVLVVGFLWFMVSRIHRDAAEDATLSARRVVALAESVRNQMQQKWHAGLFDTADMRRWADAGELNKVLASVPIITAWETVMERAEESGYEIKTPNLEPRNSDNTPDAIARQALESFAKDKSIEEYEHVDREANVVRYFRPIRLTADCLACHGDPKNSLALWGNSDGIDPTGYRMENKQVGDLHGAFEIVQKLDKAEARANASVWSGVLFSIGLLVPALGFAYFVVQRTIAVPVRRFADALKNISEGDGDLTRRLDEQGKDELAEAAKWFNRFASKVQTVIAEISGSAQSLVSASKNLSDTSSKLSDGASHTKQQTTEVATNVQGLNSNMQVIASRANGMKETFEFVQTAVSDMRATIGDIARNAEKGASVSRDAATMAESSNEKLADLGESADAIGGVIQVISDVAEQTNLLALNATIEAARAGDAGKGFAVVATEVKELARQTALAIEDIRGRIQKMQHSTSASIQQVEQINRVIRELSQISVSIAAAVEQQSTASAQISENVMSATQLAGEIADAVSESATSTTRISENLHRVDNIVTDTAEGAGKSRVAGDALVGLANQLQKLASEFRTEAATTSA